MSGSETSLIDELPNPQSITAAVSSALSLGTALEDGALVQMTAIDEATNCRRISVSTLKIGDISLRDRSPHQSLSWDQCQSSSTFNQEMIANDDVCQYFTNCYVVEEPEHSLADFPSPGKLRKTTGGNARKRSRSPIRSKSLGSPSAFSYSINAGLGWRVTLDDADLWREFSSIGTEMVITKTGRRMFPSLSVSVHGLDPSKQYTITLDIQPADQSRHKFIGDSWQAVGKADKEFVRCEFLHTDSPSLGSHWMKKPVTFKFVKLTNNRNNKSKDQASDRVCMHVCRVTIYSSTLIVLAMSPVMAAYLMPCMQSIGCTVPYDIVLYMWFTSPFTLTDHPQLHAQVPPPCLHCGGEQQ